MSSISEKSITCIQIAVKNMKYHKSKNFLTGIAIFLTTFLMFIVPTMGYDMVIGKNEFTNEMYPTWHALYRNVTEDTVKKLSVHHMISRWGLRSDAGYMVTEDADVSMIYIDGEGLDLYHMALAEGEFPKAENEIVVSKGILKALSQTGNIGDTITVPYQVSRNGGLDYKQETEFVITGFLEDSQLNTEEKIYTSFVSQDFLEKKIPKEQIRYRFLFQIATGNSVNTDKIESVINFLADQFEIPESDININEQYLFANYLDPTYVPAVIIIMLIVLIAGVITIYSIYYVSISERVQEYGKIKAIGATRRQIRKLILLEGLSVAGIAIPLGLLAGSILVKYIFLGMFRIYVDENEMMRVIRQLIEAGKIDLYHAWIYVLAAFVSTLTVYLSLLHPMKIISGVSEIDAIRYRDGQKGKSRKKKRRGYVDITIGKVATIYLMGNKKKSVLTIFSMAATGLFFMLVATILACANPKEASKNAIHAQYEIYPIVAFNDKEHPEWEWQEVQRNNPLNEELAERILGIDGVSALESFSSTYVTADVFGDEREWLMGIPRTGKEQLEQGIIEGNITYEELKSGDKVIIDENLLYWYPGLKVGDILEVTVEDSRGKHKRQLEITAIGDYPISFTNYRYLIMAQEGLETFSSHNLNFFYHIHGEEDYNTEVEASLKKIVEESGRMDMRVWKDEYERYQLQMTLMNSACYIFLGILGAICIMNMVNTMIYGVHVRKKEFGMLQAVGMSDAQLHKMLRLEGMFYTFGTLFVSIGGGSLAGYPVFLWAKKNGILNIRNYHYPWIPALVLVMILVAVQLILVFILGKIIKKDSLIDRIRFSD